MKNAWLPAEFVLLGRVVAFLCARLVVHCIEAVFDEVMLALCQEKLIS